MISPTFKTGLTVMSNMVGSVTLVIPALVQKQGLLSCLVLIAFMGAVYCKTCQLWTKHQRKDEDNVSQIVKRTLSQTWYIVFGVSSGLFLMLLCIIYFLLLNQTLYPVVRLLLLSLNVSESAIQPDTKGISFNRISIQYLGLLMALCLFPLFNLKKIDKVLAVARFGTIALSLYFAMLVVMFILSIVQNNLILSEVNLWAQDADGWIEIAGLCSFAFISHITIAPIVKDNPQRKENPKAVAYGYGLAAILYGLLGIFGGLAIQTYNYFDDKAFAIAKGLLIFLYIVSIFGIFPFVSRSQFFCFLPQGKTLPTRYFYAYNALTWVMCIFFQIINVSPGIVISITGTGVGLFVCFVIPIYIHMKCYYPEWKEPSKIEEGQIKLATPLMGSENQEIDESKPSLIESVEGEVIKQKSCAQHYNVNSWSFRTRVIFYSCLMLIGITNFGLQIKLIVDSFIG